MINSSTRARYLRYPITDNITEKIIETNLNISHGPSPTVISNSCDTLSYPILVAVNIIVITEPKSEYPGVP